MRQGGPQGRCGRVRKISPPLEFDPQTVHSHSESLPTALSQPTPNVHAGQKFEMFRLLCKFKQFVKSTIFFYVLMCILVEVCLSLQGEDTLQMDAVCLSRVKY
jgi:hypothetical protein